MKADAFIAATTAAVPSRVTATTSASVAPIAGPVVRFACGTCKDRLVVPARHAGRRGKCPNCGTINRVPRESEFDGPAGAAVASNPATTPAPLTAAAIAPSPSLFNIPAGAAVPVPDAAPTSDAALVPFDETDAVGLPPALRLLLVGGIVGVLLLAVWVAFYLLIWSRMAMGG